MTTKLKTGVAVVLSLVVLAIFFIFSNPFFSQSITQTQTQAAAGTNTVAAQLISQDEKVGTGTAAKVGDTLTVNYTGKLQDGTVFDSSIGKNPISFVLGAGKVIPGWDQGLQGMQIGGKRLLVIPPDLAYGADGYGPIPANATLIFEVDLLAIVPAPAVQQ